MDIDLCNLSWILIRMPTLQKHLQNQHFLVNNSNASFCIFFICSTLSILTNFFNYYYLFIIVFISVYISLLVIIKIDSNYKYAKNL